MKRREALERITWLVAGAGTVSALGPVLVGCGSRQEHGQTLTGDRLERCAVIAEHLIPETDTPGARSAGVHWYIDAMLTDFYEPDVTSRFLEGLEDVEERSHRAHGAAFVSLASARQVSILTALEAEDEPFFATMKSLTLTGYYTSEAGATQELHLPPYGAYLADIPFEAVGRAWA